MKAIIILVLLATSAFSSPWETEEKVRKIWAAHYLKYGYNFDIQKMSPKMMEQAYRNGEMDKKIAEIQKAAELKKQSGEKNRVGDIDKNKRAVDKTAESERENTGDKQGSETGHQPLDQRNSNIPEVESVKPLKTEKNEAGEITMKSEQIKYTGGWTQIVSFNLKKDAQSKSVVSYDQKGHISGLEVSFLKENPPLGVAEGRKILEACFETLTTKKYNPDEFRFVESDDGRTMMVWENKHEGQAVYVYLGAYALGCGTLSLAEALENGLIPK